MKKIETALLLIFLTNMVYGQNVGIGTSNPDKGRLEIFGALNGGTVASFGTDGNGISIQRNWPTIAFNQYRDLAGIARYMGAGKASWLYYDPTSGNFGWDVYDVAGTANQSITASGTRALSILSNGNIGIRSGGQADASLVVQRGTNLSGAAIIGGTSHQSYFCWNTQEDTYIRGGKDASKVIINDVPGGNILAYGKIALGNYPGNAYQPALASEIWGATALTGSYTVDINAFPNHYIRPELSSYVTVVNSSGNSSLRLSMLDGTKNGQLLLIQASGNTGFGIWINDNSNSNVHIGTGGAQAFSMGGGDILTLVWRAETGRWTRVAFSDN